ncbi:MAG: hypothetical protein ACLFTI_13030, partial [Anaerolineales bacterium]
YRVALDTPTATFQIETASISVTPTEGGEAISTALSAEPSAWTHQWLAIGALGGEQAVVKVSVEATGDGGAVYFDEITLGTTAPGKQMVFLPSVLRR